MNDPSELKPYFRTDRFDVWRHTIKRDDFLGGLTRFVYQAWFHSVDVPKPVCVVTTSGDFVEWVHVDEQYRRQGIATEVMRNIEMVDGECNMEGATDAGTAWVEAYCAADETPS